MEEPRQRHLDLVDRLEGNYQFPAPPIHKEAAAEIRKMRAEIAAAATQNERLREALEAVDGEVVLTGHLKEIVDEALGDEQTLDDVKDMATWPEEIRKAHGINPKADHAAAVGEIGRLRTALGECAKACYLDELTLEFEPTSEAKIAMAALGIERGAVEQKARVQFNPEPLTQEQGERIAKKLRPGLKSE